MYSTDNLERTGGEPVLNSCFKLGSWSLVLNPWYWILGPEGALDGLYQGEGRHLKIGEEIGNSRTGEQEQPLARSLEQNVWSEIILNWDRTVR